MRRGGDRDRQNKAAAGRKAFLEKGKKGARDEHGEVKEQPKQQGGRMPPWGCPTSADDGGCTSAASTTVMAGDAKLLTMTDLI
jgi:hypothetical protein